MRIASLHTYPVKGCRRLDHDVARVEPWGLAGDRRWMLIDPEGIGITQRAVAGLALLKARPEPGGISLEAPRMPDTFVRFPAPEQAEARAEVRVFRGKEPVAATLADGAEWFSEFLRRPARLVWLGDPTVRTIEDRAQDDDRVSFADGYPLLLANSASLAALNDWLQEGADEPVPMTRFRANVVVDGARPWAEDDWAGRRLRIGDVIFRAPKGCDRCVVTTIDQDSAERGRQPLRALGKYRRLPGGLLFGLNLIPDGTGFLHVGDPVLDLP